MNDILTIHKDFGTVICGKEVTELFEFNNEKNTSAILSVTQDEVSFSFKIFPKRIQVSPKKKARFKITFFSTVPDSVYIQRYVIVDGTNPVAKLSAQCKSLGPTIRPKQCKIKFFILNSGVSDKKRFEMENTSICPTKFQFERGSNNHPFYFSQDSGLLPAREKFIVDIKFMPSQHGIYCKKIYCLLQYHEPILITLIGLFNPKLKVPQNKFSFNKNTEEISSNNYEEYMKELNEEYVAEEVDQCMNLPLQRAEIAKPMDSEVDEDYEESYLTYDELDLKGESSTSLTREDGKQVILSNYFLNMKNNRSDEGGIKLVNTSDAKEFIYEWRNDNGKNFSVTPKNGNLRQNQILDMKIDFSPNISDRFYNGELEIRIFPLNIEKNRLSPEMVTLPRTLNLSILGHSFAAGSSAWLEECLIEPRKVELPPCLPGQIVHTTLLIKRRGQLPLVYEFLPPKKSRIKVKPPMGYISGAYQILIVQFEAPTESLGDYTELWKVIFNDKTDYFGEIPIHAKIEEPIIILGVGNSITFDTVLPCGISKSAVPLWNPTSLKLRYELHVPKYMDWIEIPILVGEIEPLGCAYLEIIFKPLEMKEYFDCICCFVKALQKPEYKTAIKVQLKGSCQDGFLVATPDCHDFGKCLCGTESKKKFYVFNFTPVLMHFKLFIIYDGLIDNGRNEIKVLPEKGSIGGKSNIEVEVHVTPNNAAHSKYSLKCQLLTSLAEDNFPCALPNIRTLITFKIEGILPIFQITDLNIEGGGPLMSPDWLWKMMDINGLNRIIREMHPNGEKSFDMRLPEAEINNSPVIIYMLIQTKNLNEMSMELKNKYRSHFSSQSVSKIFEDENQFNIMTFAPSKICLKPVSREILKLTLKFCAVGTTIYEWVMSMSQNRVIRIRTILNALSGQDDRRTCTFLGSNLNLKPVFIGDLAPSVQLYWLYNNSSSPTGYVLDKASLRDSSCPFKIFDCLNSNGIIPPFSTLPLMFTFRPNELKTYQANAELSLQNDFKITLNITGNGILNYSPILEFSHEETIPERPILQQDFAALESSVKVITIKPFSTFSNIQRIFFLKNTSKKNVWAFKWHSFNVQNIIRASVEPLDGKIKPGERLLFTLKVESFKFPTSITFSVPCDVIDFTTLEAYERAVRKKEKLHENYKDYFTITEKGTFNEIPEVEIPDEPKCRHIFVAIKTNIVAGTAIGTKLYLKEIQKLPIGREPELVKTLCDKLTMDEEKRLMVEETLEKIFWKILDSPNFKTQFINYQERFGNVTYSQIMPDSEKKSREVEKRLRETLPKYVVGSILENIMKEILKKKFYESFKVIKTKE